MPQVGGTNIKVGGMAKGSGMIHPNMATMLGVCLLYCFSQFFWESTLYHSILWQYHLLQVITTDALVNSDVWRKMVQISVNRSFNQITVCYIWLLYCLFLKFCTGFNKLATVELELDFMWSLLPIAWKI